MNNPKVSFVVPVYNAEKTIKKCINSILNQTYRNIEIICVNDGSKDNTLAILKKLQAQDSRIIVIDQKNQGPYMARKNGILRASGDYIQSCDADDFLPNKHSCEILIELFNQNKNVQMIQFGHFDKIKGFKNKKTTKINGVISKKELFDKYYKDFIGNANCQAVTVTLWDKIYESKIMKSAVQNKDLSLKVGEDLSLNLNAFDQDKLENILIIPDCLYMYNQGIGIMSKSNEYALECYGQLKSMQMDFCDKWKLCEEAKNHCNLESIYYLLNIVIDLVYVKKKSDEQIINYLNEAENYDCTKIAKDYFKSRPKEELFDELIFLVNASPEEYLDYVKRTKKKPKGYIRRCFDYALKKIGVKKTN